MEADRLSQLKDDLRLSPGPRSIVSPAAALLAGAALRGWMLHKFFEVNGDSRLYGGMARNLILHGQYALTDGSGVVHPTLIRLPGYPLFLAACFRLFGMENYFAPVCLQIAAALLGCCLLAVVAWRIAPQRHRVFAANATLWLAVLCPFTAVYDAQPLTESLSVTCIAFALWGALETQLSIARGTASWLSSLVLTVSVAYAALLRPDGALVGVALVPPVVLAAMRVSPNLPDARRWWRIATLCGLLALAPFAAWTVRNWRAFHVLQPLAPRYATDPGEDTWPGFQRWTKTWCLDFVSTYNIYWNMPGSSVNLQDLPSRAFDSPREYQETQRLLQDYEANGEELSSSIDADFARLASERISNHPLRYYAWLPLGRVADMWLRPRVENLPIDLDWWVYGHHHAETRFSWFYAGLNTFYLVLGIAGLFLRRRLWLSMLAYMVLRSLLLATIEAPEARYTIECFPMLFALGGLALAHLGVPRPGAQQSR